MIRNLCRLTTDWLGSAKECRRTVTTMLQEVGKLQKPLDALDASVSYKTGQLILHKRFGYRGIVLSPWKTKILETSTTTPQKTSTNVSDTMQILHGDLTVPRPTPRNPELFYTVLVDSDDSSFVRHNAVDGVSFLGQDSSGDGEDAEGGSSGGDVIVFTMPGIDYVHNGDILPYRLSDDAGPKSLLPLGSSATQQLERRRRPPIRHELFNRFFDVTRLRHETTEPAHSGSRGLTKWRKRNFRWLKPESAFRARSDDVTVTVIPFYMGTQGTNDADYNYESSLDQRYWWRYILRVENAGEKTLKIKRRNWTVSSANGNYDKKVEKGIEGKEVTLSQWNPCFQTTCYCSFTAPSGTIWGHLELESEDGDVVRCPIPHFDLESRQRNKNEQATA